MDVFAEEEHAELHPRILGMKPADQLLLGLRQVERQAVGLGEGADEEDQEADRLRRRSPRRGDPAS